MGLLIRCYVNGNQEFIDLYPDEQIEMEISFAELQDITKKNSAFSREFKVPGSKNNNYIFNYFFEIDSVFTDWNPKDKFEADLLYDGYEIYNGYVRLNSVSINKTEKIYSITFYAGIGDVVANIGDKALCEIDTTSLDNSLYDPRIVPFIFTDPSLHDITLITGTTLNPITNGDVSYILGQRGYDYTGTTYQDIRDINTAQTPLLDFSGVTGFFDFSGTPIISSYLIPSIRTRKMYELIINQAGYQLESDFFDTDYFGRYYIPLSFNTDQPYMAQAKKYEYEWFNISGETGAQVKTIDWSNSPNITTENLFKPEVIIKENLDYNPIPVADLSPPLTPTDVSYLFALPQANGQPFTWRITIENMYTGLSPYGSPPYIYDGGTVSLFKFLQEIGGGDYLAQFIASTDYPVRTQASGLTATWDFTGTTTTFGYEGGYDAFFVSFRKNGLFNHKITSVKFEILDSPIALPKTIELYKEMGCDHKQIDFIQDINRTFNLVVVDHPFKTKTIIVEPMINWIGKGETLDWTSKVNFDETQNLYPTTNLINGSLFLSNRPDKDYINTEYEKATNKIFGQNIINLNIDYKNQTTNLTQKLGQNTDYYLNASGDTNIALPCYFITKENNNNGISTFEYRPFRSLPRQIFKSVTIPTGNTGTNAFFYRYQGTSIPFTSIGFDAFGTFPNINRLTTYPYAISGFSHYTIYDSSNEFTNDELVYPELENMYDRYYKDYIEDITADENKIYQARMYLTPWEVSNLYFNETILIKNTRFRINKISGLSLLEPGLCSVELVKLTKDYRSSPTLYYDLISCEDACDIIHTNTDIVYPVWAFENQYVDLSFTVNDIIIFKRYKVIRTEYNENYTYTKPFFRSGIIIEAQYVVIWDYFVYEDCNSIEPINKLLITNEVLSGYTGTCVNVDITNITSTAITFHFEGCDGTQLTYTLNPSQTLNTCGKYESFQTTGLTYCLTSFTDCGSTPPFPTPTPSVTPFLTPSPTPTVTSTPGLPPSNTPSPTQTKTPTPTSTPPICRENTELLVNYLGWVKYKLCNGTLQYQYINSAGTYYIANCIQEGTIEPGSPNFLQAVFTVVDVGTIC